MVCQISKTVVLFAGLSCAYHISIGSSDTSLVAAKSFLPHHDCWSLAIPRDEAVTQQIPAIRQTCAYAEALPILGDGRQVVANTSNHMTSISQ